ncbi:BTAD domain-containing putative transcriptional regulator [Asanoa siamensis]|uniref:Bacterial transcriptional activator domain-containing protein n=1 Tax=Asanoa siamensis TaxID=926357 RepID=A0ABQ4CS54_9ACTN|nr:BTAD domain-containing putative transcriptional regulator [Asanoa siamensis]GIF74128.1 hypothetical protein Asi02nite_36460 [Asanoa siamensis]
MLRVLAIGGRLLRALAALVVLAGFTGGVPWLLVRLIGWPLDWIGWTQPGTLPGLDDLTTALTTSWYDDKILALLATLGWILWLLFCRDVIVEAIEASSGASHRDRPHRPSLAGGPIRWVAAVLVGAIVGAVLFDAARVVAGSTTSTAAADAAARRPAVPVAAAQTAAPMVQSDPTLFVRVSSPAVAPATTATALPLTARHDGSGIPEWARDAPGGAHHVVRGDNLWDLAAEHLGDPHRWREIYTLNRGHVQANGYALTDPDEIHVGWVLALPSHGAAPAPANPADDKAAPSGSANGGNPASNPGAEPAPTSEESPAPSTPPSTPATSTTLQPSISPPGAQLPESSAPAAPAGESSTEPSGDEPDNAPPSSDHDDEGGITLPPDGWVSLGLAATIAAVAALLRLQRRRRARLTLRPLATIEPQPAPVAPSLLRVDTIGGHHLGSDLGDGATPAVPAPIGVDIDGAEVSLFELPGLGIAVHGDGAEPTARAILAAVLATGAGEPADTRPVVVTTAGLLTRLLPEGTPATGLDPDGTAFDGERLIVLADTATAVTHFEAEMVTRRRLLDTFDIDTITALNARTDHAETQPPYVLLIEASSRHAARVDAVAAHRAALDLHPVILGDLDRDDRAGIPAMQVDADGTVTDDESYPAARLSTLGADDLAAVLAMLTDVLARPEAGTDVDDPPAEPVSAAAETEAAEPVPVQASDTSALVQLRVLGPVTVATDAGPIATGMRNGSYTALALLAAHPAGRTLDQLAAALHPDTETNVAVKRVRTDITSARRVLRTATGHDEPMFIVHDPATGRYRIDPATVAVDLWQMLTAIDRATNETDDAKALATLRQAVELYGGDFADGHDHIWATDYATTYRHQILTVYARIAEFLETEQPDQAVAALERAVDLDPFNEELYQRIIRIHGRQHRPDAVRRTLRRLEEQLADLGDAEPSHATRRIAERQLRKPAMHAES